MIATWFSNIRGDVRGGLISAGIAIPLAMGFGMFAFVSLGDEYFADGALAGLITAFIVGIVSVILGDRSPNVYAPRVITTFFLGSVLFHLMHPGETATAPTSLPIVLATFFAIIVLGGAFQLLFGLVRLGTLIKFVPHSVMAGFQNAAALLLFLVQIGNLFGFEKSTPFMQALRHVDDAKPLSIALGATVFLVTWFAKRMLPKLPPVLVGIVAGSAAYYALLYAGLRQHLGPVIGSNPLTALGPSMFAGMKQIAALPELHGTILSIVVGALGLALIASLDALLCAKLVTKPGDVKPDGDRLLMRLGAGNVLAGCCGGITSGLNLGPSLANRAYGGRTALSVLINALLILLAFSVFFPAVVHIPRVVMSAVIMVIAVQHIDPWTIRVVRRLLAGSTDYRRKLTLELLVVIMVALFAIFLDIVVAVFLGIAVAAILFLVRVSRAVVRRTYRCDSVRSRKLRPSFDVRSIDRVGGSILVMELQGPLFFGTAEKLANEIVAQCLQPTSSVVLDLRRVTEIDSTGAQVLESINADMASQGKHLLIALPATSETSALLADAGVMETVTSERRFPDVDRAIEWAEDELLRGDPERRTESDELDLAQATVLQGFSMHELDRIRARLSRAEFAAGEILFSQGDAGAQLFIPVKGAASAYLRPNIGIDIRLASFASGTVFGELAILDKGPRSATVVADTALTCFVLSDDEYARLCDEAPAVAIKLLTNLARALSGRLRLANRTINQLEA